MKKLAFLLLAVIALGEAGCGGGDNSDRAADEQPTVASGEVPFDRAFELETLAGDIIAAQQREIDVIEAYFKGGHG